MADEPFPLPRGTSIEHLDHEPSEAELQAIKERYLAMGFDVVSVREIERAFPRIGPAAPS